ncbi:hypothetical protein Scep_029691 [Stephania cephalantha]|uniref:Uncharacterized protein n=1 Tax=Stephania cephalantha TaxID=152367 RepID=A0AAP0HHX4_9MAGN
MFLLCLEFRSARISRTHLDKSKRESDRVGEKKRGKERERERERERDRDRRPSSGSQRLVGRRRCSSVGDDRQRVAGWPAALRGYAEVADQQRSDGSGGGAKSSRTAALAISEPARRAVAAATMQTSERGPAARMMTARCGKPTTAAARSRGAGPQLAGADRRRLDCSGKETVAERQGGGSSDVRQRRPAATGQRVGAAAASARRLRGIDSSAVARCRTDRSSRRGAIRRDSTTCDYEWILKAMARALRSIPWQFLGLKSGSVHVSQPHCSFGAEQLTWRRLIGGEMCNDVLCMESPPRVERWLVESCLKTCLNARDSETWMQEALVWWSCTNRAKVLETANARISRK